MTAVSFYLHVGRVTENPRQELDDSTIATAITDESFFLSVCSGIIVQDVGTNGRWVGVCVRRR